MLRRQKRSSTIFDNIKKANSILELLLKTSSSLLIVGVFLGSFFLFNYFDQYNIKELFSISITQPNILIFLATSSFIFASVISIMTISGPYLYYTSINIAKTFWTNDNKTTNILLDILIFLSALSIPIITSQYELLKNPIKHHVSLYVSVSIILSFAKFFSNNPKIRPIEFTKIFEIILFISTFAISLIFLIFPLYFTLHTIESVRINNENKELIQYILMCIMLIIYPTISSFTINNERPFVLTTAIIFYIILVAIFIFPKDVSNSLIKFTKLGQFEVFLNLDKKVALTNKDNEQYSKFWVLINFQDSIVVSSGKDEKIFHLISKKDVVDMKFDMRNDQDKLPQKNRREF